MSEEFNALVIHPKDNTAVVLKALSAGDEIRCEGLSLRAAEDIPRSHKAAIRKIGKGELVLRYGEPIGFARSDIDAGQWIHTHNIESEGL